jgi:tetratricopeptide (TPR) repeat protein
LRLTPPSRTLCSVLLSLLLTAVVSGCDRPKDPPPASSTGDRPEDAQGIRTGHPNSSLDAPAPRYTAAGAYLASRQAFVSRDLEAALRLVQQTIALDPGDTELRRHAMLMAVTAGQMESAEAEAAQLATRLPDDYYVALIQSVAAARRSDFATARQALGRIQGSRFSALWQPFLLAWLDVGEGKTTEAEARLSDSRQPEQLRVLALLHRALLAQMTHRPEVAEELYARLREQLTEPPLRLVVFYGRILGQQGGKEATATLRDLLAAYTTEAGSPTLTARLQQALQAPPASTGGGLGTVQSAQDGLAEALLDVGDLLNQARSRDLALVHVRLALSLRPDLPYGWLILTQMLEEEGFQDAALAASSTIPPDSPLGWQAQLQAADILVVQNKLRAAVKTLEAMRQQEPKDLNVLTRIGELLRQQERFAEAIPVYDQAIALAGNTPDPRYWTLYYARGIALERSKRWKEAEADLHKALTLMPEQPQVLNYLAYSWLEQGVRLRESLDMLVRAAAQAPDDAHIIDSLGWAYYKLGQFDAAVLHLERAVALRPFDPLVMDHLGDAYWQQGRQREARFQWQHALSFAPPTEDIRRITPKIASGL